MPVVNFFVKIMIVVLVAILFTYIVSKISLPGAIGLRPVDDGCYGVILENEEVYNNFPQGRVWLKVVNFEYYIPPQREKKSPHGFCLGKNLWDKEGRKKQQEKKQQEGLNLNKS